ncbi:MAG TPA: hypothetical protein VFE63_14345 [Roseiarcus sp.]|jgi:hypothetical protein|nr:hypothetical protein [Roseiarcus sp.]
MNEDDWDRGNDPESAGEANLRRFPAVWVCASAEAAGAADASRDPIVWIKRPMRPAAETELRMALRHVRGGRACIERQVRVLATLRKRGLPTEQADRVLLWLEEAQRQFEEHYRNLARGVAERVEPKNIGVAPFVD